MLLRGLVVCAVYVAAGKLGLSLAFVHASASAVWPPTGIALAALLVLGLRVWPAILVGAFIVNVTTSGSVATSLAIAVGNTLEGLVGAWLVMSLARGRYFPERAADILKFTVLAGLLAPGVSATIGGTSLLLAGEAAWRDYASIWLTWWLGDASGAIVLTPAIVLWANDPRVHLSWRKWIEAALLVLLSIALAVVVFGGGALGLPARNYPLTFLTMPPLMWAAFGFGRRVAASGVVLLAAIAIWGTLHDFGPFVLDTDNESLLLLQAFTMTIGVMTSVVAAIVAERRKMDALQRLAREEAERANRAKDEFLAILSHELRTPLNAVLGWTSMLRSGDLDSAAATKALATIERNARLQAQLVEDLLDVSRIMVGQLALRTEVVALGALVTTAVDSLRPSADAKGLTLALRVVRDVAVVGDPARLQQIVSNLVSNGLKFTPAGGHVTVTLDGADGRARLEVADTGKGITPDFLPHLFERFRQADASSRRAHGGLGIGLAIVRSLVDLHGGSVRAESAGDGKGATFIVDLPAVTR